MSSIDFFSKSHFSIFFYREYHQSVKQIGTRLGPTLIWVQTVCKGYQQTTLVTNEFKANMPLKGSIFHIHNSQ